MANEARITTSLYISKNNLQYNSLPTSFVATVTGVNGPSPGAINVPVTGVNVDFSALSTLGLCRIMNLDSTNFVEWGAWDGIEFIPLGEILAGESYVIRLARALKLGGDYATGTGTTGTGNALRLKADTAACKVVVEAFEV